MLNRLPVILLAATLLAGEVLAQGLTVRVEHNAGAPRMVVNDKPVRARMFFGFTGYGQIEIGPEGRMYEFEFYPNSDAPDSATMHFRFGHTPGDIWLDELSVTDLTTGEVVRSKLTFEDGTGDFYGNFFVWPPPDKNTVGKVAVENGGGKNGSAGLHVQISEPPNGVWPDFHIFHRADLNLLADHRYRVSFWACSDVKRKITAAFYKPGSTYSMLGGPEGLFASQVKLAAGAGVDFISVPVSLVWPAPGESEDWAELDATIRATIAANPNALIIPRIGLYAPAWWAESHPDEVMVWEEGEHPKIISPASEVFQKEASERLAVFVRHLEENFPNNMAGYHPCGQNTAEWFYFDSWERALSGYSPSDLRGFRVWLKDRYKNDATLQKAWSNPNVTLDTAQVPTPAERHAAPDGMFRDPVKERAILDFVEYQQDSMAQSVCDFASVVRKETGGKKLVVFFYGYTFEFGAMPTGPGSSGHYALRKVLNSPDIDVLCSPLSYFDRGRGQSGPYMSAVESVTLTGKMWLTEDDTRTHMTVDSMFAGSEHILDNAEQTNQLLRRNVAQEAMRNFATWWMDLGNTGWFDDPALWEEMKRLEAIDIPMLQNPTPFTPEVAVVVDERSMCQLADGGNTVGTPGIYSLRGPLGRMGAPYGQYLLDDVADGKVKAKLYVFASAWRLDAETRAKLRKATEGSVCIWMYAPGYFDGYNKSTEAMKELTGFDLQLTELERAIASPSGMFSQIWKPFGVEQKVWPLFTAKGVRPDEILATYDDGSPAVTERRRGSGTSIFVGAPGISADLLRYAARKAGVHIYASPGAVVYANGPFLALHSTSEGNVQINTGSSSDISDIFTGEKLGSGPVYNLPMKYAQTRILRIK